MEKARDQLERLFMELNTRIERLNRVRRDKGLLSTPKSKVQILGQMSLLANEKVSLLLSLAQTGDFDAFLRMDHAVKIELLQLLKREHLIYDEDSSLVWIPPRARFELMLDLNHVLVELINPESALVSKAVKAPEKNKQLIREAITSGAFPTLVDRILENDGKLENFI
jgi:hypothetical protein